MSRKTITYIIAVALVVICWRLADSFVMRDPNPPLVIPGTSSASYYTDGYNCGWEEGEKAAYYDPRSAANRLYSEFGENAYKRIDPRNAAAFSAGYAFGYHDYSYGEKTHRMEYVNWGEWSR